MPGDNDLPLFGTSLPASQVPPIHQKRVVAFVNIFLMKTSEFLDQFASRCEEKFMEVEGKISRMEAVLQLLEAKLDSIPDLKESTPESAKEILPQQPVTTEVQSPAKDDSENQETQSEPAPVAASEAQPAPSTPPVQDGVKAKDDYRYKKYFKMMQFGVPPAAIKMKLQAERMDPTIIDNPEQILPDGILDPPIIEDNDSDEESN